MFEGLLHNSPGRTVYIKFYEFKPKRIILIMHDVIHDERKAMPHDLLIRIASVHDTNHIFCVQLCFKTHCLFCPGQLVMFYVLDIANDRM